MLSERNHDFLWLWAMFTCLGTVVYVLVYAAGVCLLDPLLGIPLELSLSSLGFGFLVICGSCEVLSMALIISDERGGCYWYGAE